MIVIDGINYQGMSAIINTVTATTMNTVINIVINRR
jgi:hypothetical protein